MDKRNYISNVFSKKKQVIFLLVIILCMFSIVFLNYQYFKDRYIIDGTLSINEIHEIKSKRKEYLENIDLYIRNNLIPYSAVDKFYLLHINNPNDYKKIYTISDFKIKIVNRESNHTIKLLLYNDKYYKEVILELTDIPIVYINSADEINLYGFDNEIYKLNCNYSLRGDSSKNSNKKSYNLKLINQKKQKISMPLLDMKASSTWVLNPLYFDNTYIREKISYDIWNNLSDRFNHKLEYVELIINGEYQGIYYLEEKVSIETFDGNVNNDLLVSIKDWKYNVDDSVLIKANKIYQNIINEFEIEDGLNENYELQLNILKSFNDLLRSGDAHMLKYDLRNSIDYGVFINLTSAIDNTYKNQKILFKKVDNDYLIQRTIWDLDWAFANENSSRFEYKLSSEFIYDDLAIPNNLKNSRIYILLTKLKYVVFRYKYYNLENLENLINKYTNYLREYGAIKRDSTKWNNNTYSESLKKLRDYFKERIEVLDVYYGGLDGI